MTRGGYYRDTGFGRQPEPAHAPGGGYYGGGPHSRRELEALARWAPQELDRHARPLERYEQTYRRS